MSDALDDDQLSPDSENYSSGIELQLPHQFVPFLERGKYRYKVARGGRGSAKSWSIARALVTLALYEPLLILCTREYQNSIVDSVHRLITRQIQDLGLGEYFDIQQKTIHCLSSGAQFIFQGLRHNINTIRSTEGVDICWVEEAQSVTEDSWMALIPTIRKSRSEIWVSFNPIDAKDPTCKRFIEQRPRPTRMLEVIVNWRDNPWFSPDLEEERQHMLRVDPDAYDHVWEGEYLRITNAAVLRNAYEIVPFETPPDVERFYFGADFGFANDPSTLIRCFIDNDCLYVDYEAYGLHVEIDDLPVFYQGGRGKDGRVWLGVPGADKWPVKCDSSRPETISYLNRQGINAMGAEKWEGCVEDGIAHLKAFKKIYIHPRCEHTAQEARLYSFKVDQRTKDVLPAIVDKHNHTWDAIRYSLDGYIQKRGNLGVWMKLGRLGGHAGQRRAL